MFLLVSSLVVADDGSEEDCNILCKFWKVLWGDKDKRPVTGAGWFDRSEALVGRSYPHAAFESGGSDYEVLCDAARCAYAKDGAEIPWSELPLFHRDQLYNNLDSAGYDPISGDRVLSDSPESEPAAPSPAPAPAAEGPPTPSAPAESSVPPELGEPNEDGVYFHKGPRAQVPIRYKKDAYGYWEWSPDGENWRATDKTVVSGGPYNGAQPTQANKDLINRLRVQDEARASEELGSDAEPAAAPTPSPASAPTAEAPAAAPAPVEPTASTIKKDDIINAKNGARVKVIEVKTSTESGKVTIISQPCSNDDCSVTVPGQYSDRFEPGDAVTVHNRAIPAVAPGEEPAAAPRPNQQQRHPIRELLLRRQMNQLFQLPLKVILKTYI